MNQILWIAVGGAIGAVLRYLSVMLVTHVYPVNFPLGTLLVNILGSFLIGVAYAWWSGSDIFLTVLRPFFIIGVLGGFTTFSSYSMELLQLIQNREAFRALLYFTLSNTLAVLAAWGGYRLFEA